MSGVVTRRRIIGVLSCLICACSNVSEEPRVNLPVTPIVSARPRWAVASDVYVQIRDLPDSDAAIEGHLRVGDVVEIVSIDPRTVEGDRGRDTWYEVAGDGIHGWALGSRLQFYDSENRALNAARSGEPSGNDGGGR